MEKLKEEVVSNVKPKKKKYILSICFLICLILITIVVIFTKYNIKDLIKLIKKIEAKYILFSIPLLIIYILFESLATKVILKALGLNTSLKKNFCYSSIDYYFCAVTPSASGGQPMVLYYMNKDKIPVSYGSLTLLINTALFKIVLLVLSTISIIFCYEQIFINPLFIVLFVIGYIINIALVLLCFLAAFKRKWIEKAGKVIIMWLSRHKLIKKTISTVRLFNQKMDEYEEGAKLIKKNKKKFLIVLGCNFIQRIAMFSIAFFVYLSFYKVFEIKRVSFIDLFAIQVIIALCVDSLPLPGGVGISEFLYVYLFGIVYISEEIVASAMLLTRAVSFYIPLIFTAIIVIAKHISTIKCRSENL